MTATLERVAFQDMMSNNHCFGCGPHNDQGLQLKSHWEGDESVATWEPQPHHAAGPAHVLNGGIIATLIDCHGVCTGVAAAYAAEGRAMGSGPELSGATASLNVTYLRPTPLGAPVELRARVAERKGRKIVVACTLTSGGQECARGEVVVVLVPTDWAAA
jgi:acyl-coenzyme A thioesterase PaaI-like protein